MKMNRKADASMWWIIIGAVIALVVLIILMVIFTGKTNKLEGGLSECLGKGGLCVQNKCPSGTMESSAFDCETGAPVCCIGIPKKCSTSDECGELGKWRCENGGGQSELGKSYCFEI
jgi:hypothetical protein